jgi:lipopolysaccharide export LptBFGC system permease protein LptF
MRLLDRFLLRELLTPLGFCLGGFLIFWVAFDLLGTLPDLQQLGATAAGVAELYWIRLPELLLIVVPFALLLALLYVLAAHSKHHELTAMRSAGISLWRICLPYFGVGLVASLGLYALNEFWMPDAKEQEDQLKASWGNPTNAPDQSWRPRIDFKNQTDDRTWSLGAFNLTNGELRQPRIALFLAADAYREISAEGVRWTNGYWRLTNGLERIYRWAADPLPALKSKSLFSVAEMGGALDLVSRWPGESLTLTNEVFTNGYVLRRNLTNTEAASGRQWALESLRPDTGEGGRLSFRAPLGQGARRVIQAESGVWTNGAWTFFGVRDFLFRSSTDDNYLDQPYPELTLTGFTETPEIIRSEIRVGSLLNRTKSMRRPQLGSREIMNYQRLHPEIPARDRALLETQLQARFAAPWTCLVVVFIAIPFGSPSGRRNMFYGVAGSLALGFAYFVLQRLGFALGQGGQVQPWLAAWLPNLFFAVTGVVLINRVR